MCLENDLPESFVIEFVQTRWIDPKKLPLAMERLLTDSHIKTSLWTAIRDSMGLEWKTDQMRWDRLSKRNAATLAKGLLGVVDIAAEG